MAKQKKQHTIIIGSSAGLIALMLVVIGVLWYMYRPLLSFDSNNLPKIVMADAVTLRNVAAVSKFRSGIGHDFSSGGETCRSMKHYFLPESSVLIDPMKAPQAIDPDQNVPVFSPMDGTVMAIDSEQVPLGKQIHVRSNAHPSYTVRLFHVYPINTLKIGDHVTANQRIGTQLFNQQIDIAVQAMTLSGPQFVSYFDVMTDDIFKAYQVRGITERSAYIISRADRDTQPLSCKGEEFTQSADAQSSDWIYFPDSVLKTNE